MKNNNLSKIYILSFSVMLILYGFNNIDLTPGIKLMYLILPMLLSIYLFKHSFIISSELRIIIILVTSMLLSTINTLIFNPDGMQTVILADAKLVIILLLLIPFYGFYLTNATLFNATVPYIAFIFMLSNVVYYFIYYDFSARFEGLFGGANEFAFFIILYIYLMYYNIFHHNKNNILNIVTLVGLHLLVFVTLSRGAMIGLVIFYLIAYPYFKHVISLRQKAILIFLIIILVFLSMERLNKSIELLERRFTGGEGSHSLSSRVNEINAGFRFLDKHVLTVLLGNGTSISSSPEVYKKYYKQGQDFHRIHNSYFAIILENGLISFSIFIYLLLSLLNRIYRLNDRYKYVIFGYLFFILFFMFFIYMLYFLPFWLGILMINLHIKKLEEKRLCI